MKNVKVYGFMVVMAAGLGLLAAPAPAEVIDPGTLGEIVSGRSAAAGWDGSRSTAMPA
jgi:hypothetical protein